MSDRLRTEIMEELDDAWLNVQVKNSELIKPLDLLMVDEPDEFYMRFAWLCSQPEYFSFFCKHVLNIEILPFQGLMLQEIWKRKFPMLVASRGAGKTFILALYALLRAIFIPSRKIVVVGSVFRQSKYIHEYMENIWKNAPILRDMCDEHSGPRKDVDMCKMIINSSVVSALPIGDGQKIRGQRGHDILCLTKDTLIQTNQGLIEIKDYLDGTAHKLLNMNGGFEKPSHMIITDPFDVYEITTNNGYSFKCSDSHRVLTSNGWKTASELTNKDYLEIDTNDYFPQENISYQNVTVDETMGWLLGLLVSEGNVGSRNIITITNTNRDLIDRIKSKTLYNWSEYHKDAYVDKRGFNCKESWNLSFCDSELRSSLYNLGLDYCIHKDKTIPSCILKSPKNVVVEFLKGIFEGDGTGFQFEDSRDGRKGKQKIRVAYYSRSKKLCQQIQILLLKFDVFSSLCSRHSNLSKHPQWVVQANGENAFILYKLLKLDKWKINENEIMFRTLSPTIRKNKNKDKYIVETHRAGKQVYLGSFQTEEECFIAFNEFWSKSRKCLCVKNVTKLPEKEVLYDFHLPETHSFIGNGFVQHNCDEFASMSRSIFENVIAGFAAVSSSPAENVRRMAKREKANKLNIELSEKEDRSVGNQIVIAGTAYYDFNHFAEYFRRWSTIIKSRGDIRKLREIFGEEDIPESFDWTEYSIIRLPVDMLPKGFMDDGQLARSKATIHSGIYGMEFEAIFSKDSSGFFKMSLIQSCVGTQENPIILPSGPVFFDPSLRGNPNKQYVIGVDPASEVDNFSIVVVEINKDHRRIAYVWTTTKKNHTERLNSGLTDDNNFYTYCARKIRDLMILFPTSRIAMDSQGGGVAVREALYDPSLLKDWELPIYEIIEEGVQKDTDDKGGLHILEMCNFANYDWLSGANHGLRQDLENKTILFPQMDPVTIALSLEEDKSHNRLYDTLEDCIVEVEELKRELSLIEITKTPTGRDKWDTPETAIGGGRKERLRKDRYSALLMANASAKLVMNTVAQTLHTGYGGFAEKMGDSVGPADYSGPEWWTKSIRGVY